MNSDPTLQLGDAQHTPNEWRRFAVRSVLAVGGFAVVVGGAFGFDKYINWSERGTEFATTQQALNTLDKNVDEHGDDSDEYGDDQDHMERDLRGAMPFLMGDIAGKITSANAIGGDYTLEDGRTMAVNNSVDPETGDETIRLTFEDKVGMTSKEFSLLRSSTGLFKKLSFYTDTIDDPQTSGGPYFKYDFSGNDFDLGNTFTMYSDNGERLNDLGPTFSVNNTQFTTYTPAGPATERVLDQYNEVSLLLDEALSQPRK